MSDHFDITLERRLERSADAAVGGAREVRRIELITGTERRRQWSAGDKARIVVESFEPGANVSEVARRNGLSPQQLFAWRREARALLEESRDEAMAAEAPPSHRRRGRQEASPEFGERSPAFVPVVMAGSASSSPPAGVRGCPTPSGKIEIVIGDVIVRVLGEVEASALDVVLVAVRRSS